VSQISTMSSRIMTSQNPDEARAAVNATTASEFYTLH
jgi:hypothetical protein